MYINLTPIPLTYYMIAIILSMILPYDLSLSSVISLLKLLSESDSFGVIQFACI